MLKEIKQTAKHSVVYAIGNFGIKFVGFLLIPFYTNPTLLSINDYGALAVLEATLAVLVGVLSLSMETSFSRWFWDKKFVNEQKSLFFTTLSFLLLILVPATISLSYFSVELSTLIFSNSSYSFLLKLTIFTAAFQVTNNLTLWLLRLKSKSTFFVSIQIFKLFSLLILIIWGLKYKGLGLLAICQASLIVEAITFLVLIPTIIKNAEFKIQLDVLKNMISYSFPLMLASLSGVLLSFADRYMLNSMEGLDRTAIYSVGSRIANTLKILVTMSLSLALLPMQMKKMDEAGNERFFAKIFKYSSFIFSISLLALSLFSLEVLKVISGSPVYWEANGVVCIISFALLFNQLKNDAMMGLIVKKRTKIVGLLVLLASLLNIGLNFVLIPIWDIYGASMATLLAQIFFFMMVYYSAQKAYFIPFELRNTLVLIVVLAIFVSVGLLVSDLNIGLRLIVKLLLLILFPFVLLSMNYYNKSEKEAAKLVFNTWRKPGKLKENLMRFFK